MIPKLDSFLRHVFTGWITLALAWLVTTLALDEKAAATVNDGLQQIGAGLVLVLGTLAPIVGRIAWSWISTLFRRGSGEVPDEKRDGTSSGGMLGLIALGTVAALVGGSLPSCSPAFEAPDIPIRACVVTDQGTICYSAKGGLSAEIDARSSK